MSSPLGQAVKRRTTPTTDMDERYDIVCHRDWAPLLGDVLLVRARAYEAWNGPRKATDLLREETEWLAKWKPRSHVRLFVARVGEELVGYLIADERQPQQFYIGHIGVLPEHQRCGVGNALIKRCETEARTLGCHSVYTSTYSRYPAMLALLSKRGYVKVQPTSTADGEESRLIFSKRC